MQLKVTYGEKFEYEFTVPFSPEFVDEIVLKKVWPETLGSGNPDWIYKVYNKYESKTS